MRCVYLLKIDPTGPDPPEEGSRAVLGVRKPGCSPQFKGGAPGLGSLEADIVSFFLGIKVLH